METKLEIEAALARLVAEGKLETHIGPDGQVNYCLPGRRAGGKQDVEEF